MNDTMDARVLDRLFALNGRSNSAVYDKQARREGVALAKANRNRLHPRRAHWALDQVAGYGEFED